MPWAIALEALTYSEESKTTGFYSISVRHYELGVYGLRFFNYESTSLINSYTTAGLGVLKEKIETTLSGTTQSDNSDTHLNGKVGVGLWSAITENYVFNLEAKAMFSQGLDPKMMFNLAFRTGVQF